MTPPSDARAALVERLKAQLAVHDDLWNRPDVQPWTDKITVGDIRLILAALADAPVQSVLGRSYVRPDVSVQDDLSDAPVQSIRAEALRDAAKFVRSEAGGSPHIRGIILKIADDLEPMLTEVGDAPVPPATSRVGERGSLLDRIDALLGSRERVHYLTIAPLLLQDIKLYLSPEASIGVGDGRGQLFVHGSTEAIIAVQRIILEREEYRRRMETAEIEARQAHELANHNFSVACDHEAKWRQMEKDAKAR